MIAREGYPMIGAGFVLMLMGLLIHPILFGLLALFFLFCVYFFRSPKRVVPTDEGIVISPADGKIISADRVFDDRYFKQEATKVSIFMSPLNVHVNRMPVTGTIQDIHYQPGIFTAAFSTKASDENEQNAICVVDPKGRELWFVQIAGWLARRIVCHASLGQTWERGAIFGLIRFGSRVDVYLPLACQVQVTTGQKVKAGETVIGKYL